MKTKLFIILASIALMASLLEIALPTKSVKAATSGYFRTITINSGQVPSIQTDFPLLVSITDASLKTIANSGHVVNANGSDIYFTDSTGVIQYP